MAPITYQQAGVDPEKAAKILGTFSKFLQNRPKDPNLVSGIGPYASCYSLKSLLNGMEDPLLVTCCDGVGTKLKLALDWNHLDGIGQDLVAMNVNDLLCIGAKPLVFLDYFACSTLEEDQWMTLLKSIQSGCELAGVTLAGGETAEMPGLYNGRDFDLAGFAVGIVDRKDCLGSEKVGVGDTLIAVESSGIHSNGYTLIRKIVETQKLKPTTLAPWSQNQKWQEVLLKPTSIYCKAFDGLLEKCHALAHITGGGLFENLPRILPKNCVAKIDSHSWSFPPLFQWIQEVSGNSTFEMLSTFNCGVGMLILTTPGESNTIRSTLQQRGFRTFEVGKVENGRATEGPAVLWE